MRVLILGNTTGAGSRFNGADLAKQLRDRGHTAHFVCWDRRGERAFVRRLLPGRGWGRIKSHLDGLEERLSLRNVLRIEGFELLLKREFWEAEVVHLHLIHAMPVSLLLLPILSALKPTVWTIHDPWAFTGHCVHPLDCERWRTGCGKCPHLDTIFAVRRDTTAATWRLKRWVYRRSRLHMIVASPWMERMAKSAALSRSVTVSRVAFGIDLAVFTRHDKASARERLGLPKEGFVVGFRSTTDPFKGLEMIREALQRLTDLEGVVVLTTDHRGQLADLKEHFEVVELGWVGDPATTVAFYSACDLFLMPSTADAFGLMAVEAMACGVAVVVAEGTALPEVVGAPEVGFSVPAKDARALAETIRRLYVDEQLRSKRGELSRRRAVELYAEEDYLRSTIAVYERAIAERGRRDR